MDGRQQHGAVAFEFLLLFPFVISLIYAAGVYGVLFSWQVRMQVAVDRSVAAVMALDRSGRLPDAAPEGCSLPASFSPDAMAEYLAECAIQRMVPSFMGTVDAAQACRIDDGQVVCELAVSTGAGDAGCEESFAGAVGSGNGPSQLGFFRGFPPLPDCLTASARVAY